MKHILNLFIILFSLFTASCNDTKDYENGKRIALGQYILGCTGGSSESCKAGCDAKCGVGTAPLTTAKLDCAKVCSDECTRNCGTILLFILNSK